jgi:hypothetical protein
LCAESPAIRCTGGCWSGTSTWPPERGGCQAVFPEGGLNFSRLDRRGRFPETEKLCRHPMRAVNNVVPVPPVSLVGGGCLRHRTVSR